MVSVVVIGASAGGLDPLRRIVAAVPCNSNAAIFIVMHIGPSPSDLPSLLYRPDGPPVAFAEDGIMIKAGRIYVAPPDHHVLLEQGWMRLSSGPKVNHTRPAADPLFMSAAASYGDRVIGIVLSGWDGDGADGLRAIQASGGRAIVQQPDEASVPSMPLAALQRGHPDACLAVADIAREVAAFCADEGPPLPGRHHQASPGALAVQESLT